MSKLIDTHNQINLEPRLTQSPQNIFCRFCYLYKIDKDNYEIQTPFIMCKDYLNEILYKEFNPTAKIQRIYGMEFDHIDPSKTNSVWRYMALNIELDIPTYEARLEILNREYPTFKLTSIVDKNPECPILPKQDKKNLFIIRFDKEWMRNTILLSFFTWCLRELARGGTIAPNIFELTKRQNPEQHRRVTGFIKNPEKFRQFQCVEGLPLQYQTSINKGSSDPLHCNSGWFGLGTWKEMNFESDAVKLLKELNQ